MTKQERLNILYTNYKREFEGNEIVLGEGNLDASLLLVGEAPGRDEVKQGSPFVGMAGKNLSEFLEVLKVERASIFITNAIKFRLSKVNPETGHKVNRPATREEIESNRKYVLEEIDIIRPEIIVTLGNVSLKSVTGNYNASIGSSHGEIQNIDIMDRSYKLFPLYHPASIIYNRGLKDVYMADLQKLRAVLKDK
ncbi:MAG TPA: uracil-DNA glycosylase [Clostridiaceae bacterium]|nr:uracil-DNA glycosylase [Clostridiaceae bacterium]